MLCMATKKFLLVSNDKFKTATKVDFNNKYKGAVKNNPDTSGFQISHTEVLEENNHDII